MPYISFEKDLKKVGLSDKEAAVYVSALGLGPSSVQPIARKAKVARATTYLVLDSLMAKGLVSKYMEGEKTLFIAENPHRLIQLVEDQEKELQNRRMNLGELIPELEALMKSSDDRPVVRYYSGLEGLRAMRGELSMHSKTGDEWYQLAPVDYMAAVYGEAEYEYVQQRRAKGIRSKAIIITESAERKKNLMETADRKWAQRAFVDSSAYNSASGFTVFRDFTSIGTWNGKTGGIIIESESVAQMMRGVFEMAWKNLDNKS